ncbi:MAG TPA: potassium transporter TrkG [Fibrobacteraceae bacterium]|nr:potassium transporter TrkG [Fibrobacteraceae bacterium]
MLKSRYQERTQAIQSLSHSPGRNYRRPTVHPLRLPALGFLGLITLGTFLLWLPPATTSPIRLIDAFFTATSASCVTGLAVVDTGTRFTLFGQFVLMVLMEIGGLGIMTISTLLMLVAGGRAGLSGQVVLLANYTQADGSFSPSKILREVFKFTLIIEGVGAVIYFTQVPHLPLFKRIFFSIFHSVSAFCNAGFSTLSTSFTHYRGDWIFNLNTCLLIVSGGIGFLTLSELFRWRKKNTVNRLSLHSRLALSTSALLILVGMAAILFFDFNNTLRHLSWPEKLLASFFQSVTSRTAGFNTLDIHLLSAPTLFTIMILMYIGGSPGSCAGGIKTTTSAVMGILGINRFLGRERTQIMSRTIPEETVDSATRLFVVSIAIIAIATLLLSSVETWHLHGEASHAFFLKALFECISAFATCGLSMDLTPTLSDPSKLILIVLMYVGRLGPLGIITAVAKTTEERPWYAEEHIMIG